MGNTKHTPTPWRVVNGSLIKDELMPFDRDERDTALIATTGGTATNALAEANAAFIVLAVNSHEKLVTALEMVRDADDDAGRDGLPRIPLMARARIDAALAAAGVE